MSFFIVFVLCLQIVHSFLDSNLIGGFLDEKSVSHATIIGCFEKNEALNIAKTLAITREISILNMNRIFKQNLEDRTLGNIALVVDGDCEQISHFLKQSGNFNLFNSKHHWLIITSLINFTTIFNNVNLNINANIQIATPGEENFIIYDVYNPGFHHGGQLKHSKIGVFNTKEGYNARITKSKYELRRNMSGVTFKSIIVLPVPFEGTLEEYLKSDHDRDVNTFNRFHNRLVDSCRNYYNFNMEIQVSNSWGYTFPNGSFDGLVGGLERKTIDFGNSPLFVREDRGKVIDYGRNTWILRATFVFRNPKARTSMEIFLKPLSTTIWLITAFFATISVIILKIVTSFERRKYHDESDISWSVSVLVTLGAFCQQGAPKTPRMTCGRITTISIFLLSAIIYQFYSASIVSHLLQKPTTNIRTISDLLNSPIKVGCEDILYDRDYFKHTTDKLARELYEKKILSKGNHSNFLEPELGLELVRKGDYAFHVETATAYPIIEATFPEKAICELNEIPLFRIQPMHANYQKNSPFRDMLDSCLQRTAEFGILYREKSFWHPRKPECIQSSKSVTFNVGFKEFYPALLPLVFGFVTSITMLIIERQIKVVNEQTLGSASDRLFLPFVK